ncbi:unnamed protein product [Danaus chrysippus]|uniref:(African queen) hypothetical protein n=1 Tax=Danaus chrysippus TaxID=151541 RepID=A0A8J2QIS8_9NEOP|nr:unnamed protein product [Danaus chrysippus]
MRSLILLMILTVTCVLSYDEKYDSVDVDAILADDGQFTSYLDCFLDKAPCTTEYSKEFREKLPEVIKTACEKCSDTQKVKVRKFVKAIFEKKPELAQEFRTKFDPSGEHEPAFLAFLKQSK